MWTANPAVISNHRNCKARVISFFKPNNLPLLRADKEGGFLAMPENMLLEKAGQAIDKNFVPVKASSSGEKKQSHCNVQGP